MSSTDNLSEGIQRGSLRRVERFMSRTASAADNVDNADTHGLIRARSGEFSGGSRVGSSSGAGVFVLSGGAPPPPSLPSPGVSGGGGAPAVIFVANERRNSYCASYCGGGDRRNRYSSCSGAGAPGAGVGAVEFVDVNQKAKRDTTTNMEDIETIGGVMQGQPQQVSGGQVRYFQALMERTTDLQRRIDLLESRMPDWNWAEECETEKWAVWWRHTVFRVAGFIFYNFILCLVSGVLSIYWHLLRSLFLHRPENERTNTRSTIALVVFVAKVIAWYCGRKVHTGRVLTWAIIVVDILKVFRTRVNQAPSEDLGVRVPRKTKTDVKVDKKKILWFFNRESL